MSSRIMRRFLILFSSLWFCVSAQAAPAINSEEPSHVAHHQVGSPFTWTFNNVAGTTLFVGVDINQNDAVSFGAVTYNGVSMTAVPGSLIKWYSNGCQIQWFYLNNPATGSHPVSVSTAGGTVDIIA